MEDEMEKKGSTTRQAVWIGIMAGFIPVLLISMVLNGGLYGSYFLLPSIGMGIMGAFIGKSMRGQSKTAIWIGAVFGAFIGGGICFYMAFVGQIFS
jgi:hypothetical protein